MIYILLNFDEFFFLKIGNWEGKINLEKKCFERKNYLKINVFYGWGGGEERERERNYVFLKLYIFILLYLIILLL